MSSTLGKNTAYVVQMKFLEHQAMAMQWKGRKGQKSELTWVQGNSADLRFRRLGFQAQFRGA